MEVEHRVLDESVSSSSAYCAAYDFKPLYGTAGQRKTTVGWPRGDAARFSALVRFARRNAT
jgi:hypothetical protein